MSKEIPIQFSESVTHFEGEGITHDEKGLFNRKAAPGTAWWSSLEGHERPKTGIWFTCPCGCGNVIHLPVKLGFSSGPGEWSWDGNEVHPTLNPSILRLPPSCGWHGWLRNGVWITC